MTPIAIAGLQLELSAGGGNFPRIESRLRQLMEVFPWVQMAVISELAVHGAATERAETLPSPTEQAFQRLAESFGIWLLPGTAFERDGERIYNTAAVIAPDGSIAGRYRKMFPFRPYEIGVEAGTEFLVFDVPEIGRFGVSICYDLWFPETVRTLTAMGAEVILHPAMTTTIDRDVELAIARASAATNQCFVVDINGAGGCGNGRSVIVGPAGEVIYQAGTGEELIPLEIDLEQVRRGREFGLFGLGQTLKSFRDREVELSVYIGGEGFEYLDTLGPLVKPERGSLAGLGTKRRV